MNRRETDELKNYFGCVVRKNFVDDSITRVVLPSRANVTFYYLEWKGQQFVIKKYPDKELFERELSALKALRGTNRVCPVLFHSRLLDEYWVENLSCPFFVVKPRYQYFLKNDINGSPLLLIERAAQEVSISDRFFNYGWRDLDGNLSNDAIDDDHRIIRFDLDRAHPRWASADRHERAHLRDSDGHACEQIVTAQNHLFQEEAELDSLAIRLSRLLLLRHEANQWDLLNKVLSIKHQRPPRFLARMLKLRSRNRARKRLLKVRGEWVGAWVFHLTSGSNSQILLRLTKPEAAMLALIFFHILTEREHGLSFKDVYFSLMLVDLAALSFRCSDREAMQLSTKGQEQFVNLVGDLHEIHHFVVDQATDVGAIPQVEELPPPTPVQEVLDLSISWAGNAWQGRGKGTGRESEDMVIFPPSEDQPILLLADGASLANGLQAIQTTRAIFDEWIKTYVLASPANARKEIARLIRLIHAELLNLANQNRKAYETTIVIAAIINDGPKHSLLLARYGNSGFFVTHETPDGLLRYLAKSNSRRTPSALGTFGLALNPLEEIKELWVNEQGTYRVRLYSDGVAETEELAQQRLDGLIDISELVARASQWDSDHSTVGDDDWSIAGFDIISKKTPLATQPTIASQTPAVSSNPMSFPQFDPQKFALSNTAIAFWQNTLQEDPAVRPLLNYPLIPDVLGSRSPPEVTSKGGTPPKPVNSIMNLSQSQGEPRLTTGGSTKWSLGRFYLISILIAATAWLVVVTRSCRSPATADLADNASSRPTPARRESPPLVLNFSTPAGRDLYEKLSSGQRVIVSRLASSSGVDREPLKSFVRDLGEVLLKTRMRVMIQVHTDLTGSTKDNVETASDRATKLKTKLLGIPGLLSTQIQTDPVGEDLPYIQVEKDAEDQALNRRLIVWKLND